MVVYLDDMVVYSSILEEYVKYLKLVYSLHHFSTLDKDSLVQNKMNVIEQGKLSGFGCKMCCF